MTDHAAARAHYEGLLRELLAEARAVLPVEFCGTPNSLAGRIDDLLFPEQGEPVLGSLADPADLVIESYGDGYAFFRR